MNTVIVALCVMQCGLTLELIPRVHVVSIQLKLHVTTGIDSDINLLIDQKLLRRIRKLGDYMGAVIQLVGEVNLLPPQVLQTLVIQEVRTEITGFCTV